MSTNDHSEDEDIPLYSWLSPQGAARLRRVMTAIGSPPHCFVNGCRRSRTCSTRQVLCWQIAPQELEPYVMLYFARQWQVSVAAGNAEDWAPAEVAMLQRVLPMWKQATGLTAAEGGRIAARRDRA